MGNKTLYIKDQDEAVWKEVEELTTESVSSLATRLIRQEVEKIKGNKKQLSGENSRIVVKVQETDGFSHCVPRTVAFNGRWIFDEVELANDKTYSVAVTEKQRFFVLIEDEFGSRYAVHDSIDELAKIYPDELMHRVAHGLGTEYVEELDI